MKPDLSAIDLFTAREQLCRREFSALELTEACLRQIERLNPAINAFITLAPELARQGAAPAAALKAATAAAAKMCSISDCTGTLQKGKLADCIGVEGNPLENRARSHRYFGRTIGEERLNNLR